MKILFYVERGLYECIKIYFNINFLYNHPKASKQPLIAVPIIMNNPVYIQCQIENQQSPISIVISTFQDVLMDNQSALWCKMCDPSSTGVKRDKL